jgi:hypothetical protein
MFDGTTGKPCTVNADCLGTGPGAPGINICSNTLAYMFTRVTFQIYPTPVCEMPPPASIGGNCDPCGGAPCDGNLHFCDGPDEPSSPGLCLPSNFANPTLGQGICVPYCTLPLDGSPGSGCAGKNRCVPYTWVLSPPAGGGPGVVTGYGFCQGACEIDSDCSALGAGWLCQADIGFCTRTKVARTKAPGTACLAGNSPTSDNTTGACYCVSSATTNVGYCSASCVVGGAPCASGYVCDGFEPSGPLLFGDAGAGMLTMQNAGVVGTCLHTCTQPDAGDPACPANSTCQAATLAGPDCIP